MLLVAIRAAAETVSDTTTLTLRLPAELKERLGVLAAKTKRARSTLASEALADYVERELAAIEAVQRGLDDMRAGRVVPHGQAMRRVRQAIDRASKGQR
jgi:predicted transcriptional regulator